MSQNIRQFLNQQEKGGMKNWINVQEGYQKC